jgi:hypothetical protein
MEHPGSLEESSSGTSILSVGWFDASSRLDEAFWTFFGSLRARFWKEMKCMSLGAEEHWIKPCFCHFLQATKQSRLITTFSCLFVHSQLSITCPISSKKFVLNPDAKT